MLFNSLLFLYLFLPLTLAFVCLLPRLAGRHALPLSNLALLLASLLFYAWGGVWSLAVLLGSIVLNYLAGLAIGAAGTPAGRRHRLTAGVTLNLLLLGVFKYSLFLTNNLAGVVVWAGGTGWNAGDILLPLGISFYTFKGIGYLIAVKRQEQPAEPNFIRLALNIGLFPELIAGPIDRYGFLARQIRMRSTSFELFASGVKRFTLGLFKKVIIATPLAYVADHILNNPAENLSTPLVWLGAVSYMFQIYYDFSGYTDMAIGLGRMVGFNLSENFNFPYISRSVREFWQRWHITLSTWLRDYLFLPLAYSASRKLSRERYLGIRADRFIYIYATLVTFLLCGFWHGAAWNFVVWGALHGLMLSLEHTPFGKWLARTPRPVQHLYVTLFLLSSLILFRTASLPEAFGLLGVMSGMEGVAADWGKFREFFDSEFILMGSIALLGSTPFFRNLFNRWRSWSFAGEGTKHPFRAHAFEVISVAAMLLVLMLTTMRMISQTNTPFIYFQF